MCMKLKNIAAAACLLALSACSSENKQENAKSASEHEADSGYVIEKVSYSDSVTVGRSKAVSSCKLTYLKPEGTPPGTLVKNVDAWERKMLSVDNNSVAMGLPLAKTRVTDDLNTSRDDLSEWSEDDTLPGMTYEFNYDIEDIVTAPKYITMLFTTSVYTGGAHGLAGSVGQTFVVPNGAKLGYDMFKKGTEAQVLELVKKGLMEQYFQVNSEKEFYGLLNDSEKFGMPSNPPYFDNNGVAFQYQYYEITAYYMGMPNCIIPFDSLKPYFTESVLRLLGDTGNSIDE